MTPHLTITWTNLSDDQSTKGGLNLPNKDLWEENSSYFRVKKTVKCTHYRPGVAQRVGKGIALLFHDRGTRRG